jgi:hypothetical protein
MMMMMAVVSWYVLVVVVLARSCREGRLGGIRGRPPLTESRVFLKPKIRSFGGFVESSKLSRSIYERKTWEAMMISYISNEQ